MRETQPPEEHLRAEDFFQLVLPPAGEPEALPGHLSACPVCARQFAQWRAAAEGLAGPSDPPPADFERKIMDKIRSASPRRSRPLARRWTAATCAAACLAAAFWLGIRVGKKPEPPSEVAGVSSMSEPDRADDELLRDVSRLVSSEEESRWKSLAPLPGGDS